MNAFEAKTTCPRCGNYFLKEWNDLSEEERTAASVMPASAEFSSKERKKHRFCTRCWFEERERPEIA